MAQILRALRQKILCSPYSGKSFALPQKGQNFVRFSFAKVDRRKRIRGWKGWQKLLENSVKIINSDIMLTF